MVVNKKMLAEQAKQFSQLLKDYGIGNRSSSDDDEQSKKNTQ